LQIEEILRQLSVLYYLVECITQISGPGKIVEVDETQIFSVSITVAGCWTQSKFGLMVQFAGQAKRTIC
jgi:hypothetical protein